MTGKRCQDPLSALLFAFFLPFLPLGLSGRLELPAKLSLHNSACHRKWNALRDDTHDFFPWQCLPLLHCRPLREEEVGERRPLLNIARNTQFFENSAMGIELGHISAIF